MTTIAGIAGVIGAVAYLALFCLLVVAARSKPIGRLLMAATAASAVWFAAQAVIYQFQARIGLSPDLLLQMEFVRDLAWLAFFARLLLNLGDAGYRFTIKLGVTIMVVTCVLGMLLPELLNHTVLGIEFTRALVRFSIGDCRRICCCHLASRVRE